jgi:GNAT superfamily N-acetyltransferase
VGNPTAPPPALDRLTVRLTRDEDVPAMEALFVQAFEGAWPPFAIDSSIHDHIEWKLNADPQSRSEQIVASPNDDEDFVICAAIRIRRPGWVRGESRVLMDAADMSVHPNWRGIGLSTHLRASRVDLGQIDDFDVLLQWLPHHPATRKTTIVNPTLGNRVLVLFRPRSLRSLVAVPLRTVGWRQVARVLGEVVRRPFRRGPARFEGELVDLDRFDDRTDALWEAAKPEFDFAVARTQDYLNWRYRDPRSGRFELRAAIEGGELLGYIVTKPHADPAEIVDVLVRPGRLDALAALVRDAVGQAGRDSGADLTCWLPTVHPYAATLRRLGFYDTGRDPSLRYEPAVMTADDLAFLLDPQLAVHVTHGDSDFT